MLSSSQEYLQALREGNYLRFLEWPRYLTHNSDQDADDTISFITFEWLKNGFFEEDAKKVALIYAAHEKNTDLLRGNLTYSLTAISIATFQCMIFQINQLTIDLPEQDKIQPNGVLGFMKKTLEILSIDKFNHCLEQQQQIFYSWVNGYGTDEIDIVCEKIKQITKLRDLVDEYISILESTPEGEDSLRGARTSVVKRLAVYLNNQTELNLKSREEIANYVNMVKAMQPAEWEEEVLMSISPPTILESTLRIVAKLGMTLFQFIDNKSLIDAEKKQHRLKQ